VDLAKEEIGQDGHGGKKNIIFPVAHRIKILREHRRFGVLRRRHLRILSFGVGHGDHGGGNGNGEGRGTRSQRSERALPTIYTASQLSFPRPSTSSGSRRSSLGKE